MCREDGGGSSVDRGRRSCRLPDRDHSRARHFHSDVEVDAVSMTPRITLNAQIRCARAGIRVHRAVARYRISKGESAAWIGDLIEAQKESIKVLAYFAQHRATILEAVAAKKAKEDAIRDIAEDERVRAVMAIFPGAEVADVREIEEL